MSGTSVLTTATALQQEVWVVLATEGRGLTHKHEPGPQLQKLEAAGVGRCLKRAVIFQVTCRPWSGAIPATCKYPVT